MPTRPASFRPRHLPVRAELRREYDAKRRQTKPWRALYKTPEWQARRAAQLAAEPLCRRCTARGLVTAATVVIVACVMATALAVNQTGPDVSVYEERGILEIEI